jgi:NitT/TauT family transport system ATP-binding protein
VIRLEAKGISRSFPNPAGGERTVLDAVDLHIEPGSFTCLLGPSGCGKSTLLHILAGFDKPNAGQALAGGQPITGPDPTRPVIFQEPGLFPWRTVLGNVLFPLEARGERGPQARDKARSFIELVGLTHAVNLFPHQLSGGMKQRTSLARALAVQPQALFLDEPFAALDTFTRFKLQDELLRLWKEQSTTVVFVTHDIDEAVYLAERVVLLSPGRGRISHEISIRMARPCDRTSPSFLAARREVYAAFELVHEEADQGYAI